MTRTQSTLCLGLLAWVHLTHPAHAALISTEDRFASGEPFDAAALIANPDDDASRDGRVFALAASKSEFTLAGTAAAVGSRTLPTPATLNLWTFITSIRAQQQGDRFVILESHVSLLKLADAAPASPVPLPGAAWMMVMGLLGFVGSRITGVGRRAAPPVNPPQPMPA